MNKSNTKWHTATAKSEAGGATARPWRINDGAPLLIESVNEDKPIAKVSQCGSDGGTPKTLWESCENARLIVQAVNQFDALNAVADAAQEFYNSQCGGNKKCGHGFPCICAGDAMAKALSTLTALKRA